jgi:tetratricopeptide (TPR) repeat protein
MSRASLKLFALFVTVVFFLPACRKKDTTAGGDDFLRLSNVGKAHLDRGEAQPALAAFEKALALNANHPDAKLNLANACLLAGEDAKARALAASVLEQDRGSATALYVSGVAALHARDYTNAIQMLQQAKDIDIRVNAVSLQLGLAYEGLGKFEEALAQYEEIAQFEPDFPGLHFRLSQAYTRLNRAADAAAQMQQHQQWLAKNPNAALTSVALERCKYTEARVPFQLEQPEHEGISVVFTDVTSEVFGGAKFTGPAGVIDFARNGTNHLLLRDGDSFRVLLNRGGKFFTNEQSFVFTNGGRYTRWLVADLNKDTVPDALVLGDRGVHLYRFTTNGTATETTRFAGLNDFAATDGLFADLNFRGDLDLVTVSTNGALRIMSNLEYMYFADTSTNAPAFTDAHQIAVGDWNNDETQDLFVARTNSALTLLLKQRGGAWSNAVTDFPAGSVAAVGDLNNDLRPDLVVANGSRITFVFEGMKERPSVDLGELQTGGLRLIDYDNDGWTDVVALGSSSSHPALRVLRNGGTNGFHDVTTRLGLGNPHGRVESFVAADIDNDCDTDFIVSIEGEGVRVLRNDGGNKNHQLRIALQGTRSNSSGLGVRVDVAAGGLRVARRVRELPVEIGVGKHKDLDAVNVHWFELSPSYTEIVLTNCEPLRVLELSLPTGSCPYLYSDDGDATRFVADLLCSSPLGLPVAPGKYVEADEDEIVWIGNEKNFRPGIASRKDAKGAKVFTNYVLRITEELREALYLDEAKLIAADHPPGTEVHSTSKMLAGKSSPGFGRHELVTLRDRIPLRSAINDAGIDVTRVVSEIDQAFASPTKLREPQLRGLAESHSVIVDFGDLPTDRPLVLALTGWLRFGGGMANIAASSYGNFPFPFPTLEAEVNGKWQRVEVELGAPSGRAKTIVTDLAGKLPSGTRRLRVTAAFEIHWDRIALFERAPETGTRVARLAPTGTDLHRRGYSEMNPLPGTQMLVPDYKKVQSTPLWRLTPSGWATRYGEVDELIAARDNALAIIAAGDELTIEFAAEKLPPKPANAERDFFVFVSGWDKDSDFHVATGTTIEPLPWHGLNHQTYGTAKRPAFTNDAWIHKYNTRWVGERILSRW